VSSTQLDISIFNTRFLFDNNDSKIECVTSKVDLVASGAVWSFIIIYSPPNVKTHPQHQSPDRTAVRGVVSLFVSFATRSKKPVQRQHHYQRCPCTLRSFSPQHMGITPLR